MRLKALATQYSVTENEVVAFFAEQREHIDPDPDTELNTLQVLMANSSSAGLRSWMRGRKTDDLRPTSEPVFTPLTRGEQALAGAYLAEDEAQYLFNWAYFPKQKIALEALHEMLPQEQWRFGNTLSPYKRPMLRNYLRFTFMRLVHESNGKIVIKGKYATFNTGLKARNGKFIYAGFKKRNTKNGRKTWEWKNFCTAGDGENGTFLQEHFKDALPLPANYGLHPRENVLFRPEDQLEINWKHIITDHVERLPVHFIRGLLPETIKAKEASMLPKKQQVQYRGQLKHYLAQDSEFFLGIQHELNYSVAASLSAVRSNPDLVAKIYFPKLREMSLLLPLYLPDSPRNSADLALVLSEGEKGKFVGMTIYTPDMAYQNCRLLGTPPTWLNPWEAVDTRRKKQRPASLAPRKKVWDLPA